MDRKPKTKHLALPLLAALTLGAALVFFLWPQTSVVEAPVQEPKVVAQKTPEPPVQSSAPAAKPRAPAAPAAAVSAPAQTENIPPPFLARNRTPLDGLRQSVMTSNPDIAQFRQLQRKVLPRPEEKEMLRSMYKDRELIEAAKRDLIAADEKVFTQEGQFKRLYRVEYLGMALEWKENPERQALLKDVEELVLARNISKEQDMELRRSLSGDKVELFMIMLYNDRKRAEELLASVKGTELEKLLTYSMRRFDALWALANK